MRTIVIDDASVCQSVTRLRCAKTSEQIDVLLYMKTPENPRNIVLDGAHGVPIRVPPRRGGGCSMRLLPNYFDLLLGWYWPRISYY